MSQLTPLSSIMPFNMWNMVMTTKDGMPQLPSFYWNVYSYEQRIKEICLRLHRVMLYENYAGVKLNKVIKQVNDMIAFIDELNDHIVDLNTSLENEIAARKSGDQTLQTEIEQEISDRKNAANDLLAKLNKEITDRTAEIARVDKAIAKEVEDRTAAVNAVQDNLDTEVTARKDADNAEATARANADKVLDAKIAKEVTDRTAADNAEATARADADADLLAKIKQEVTDRTAADNAESAARIQGDKDSNAYADNAVAKEADIRAKADANLQTLINAEAENRTNADSNLAALIKQEVSDRGTADTALSDKIAAEVTNRENAVNDEKSARSQADANLQKQIDTVNARADVVDVVGTKENLDGYDKTTLSDKDIIEVMADETHNGETTYYRYSTTEKVFTYIGSLGSFYTKGEADERFMKKGDVDSNFTDINNALAQEIKDRKAGDQVLAQDLAAEVTARTNGDNAATEAVANEATARANADTQLQSNIDAKVNSSDVVKDNLFKEGDERVSSVLAIRRSTDGKVSESNLIATQKTVKTAVDAETAARTAKDEALQNQINDLIGEQLSVENDNVFTKSDKVTTVNAIQNSANQAVTAENKLATIKDIPTEIPAIPETKADNITEDSDKAPTVTAIRNSTQSPVTADNKIATMAEIPVANKDNLYTEGDESPASVLAIRRSTDGKVSESNLIATQNTVNTAISNNSMSAVTSNNKLTTKSDVNTLIGNYTLGHHNVYIINLAHGIQLSAFTIFGMVFMTMSMALTQDVPLGNQTFLAKANALPVALRPDVESVNWVITDVGGLPISIEFFVHTDGTITGNAYNTATSDGKIAKGFGLYGNVHYINQTVA